MANPFAQMAEQIGNIKSLRQEITEILGAADNPMTCKEIGAISKTSPDSETLSREVGVMKNEGILIKLDADPEQCGAGRRNVAAYKLNPEWKPAEEGVAEPSSGVRKAADKAEYQPTGWAKTILAELQANGPMRGMDLADKCRFKVGNFSGYTKPLTSRGLAVTRQLGRFVWIMTPDQVDKFAAMHHAAEAPAAVAKAKETGHENQVSETATETPAPVSSAQTAGRNGMQFLVDASLTIIDADEILRIPPAEACRLAEFMRDCAPVFGS